jgi:hypothetical protein
MDLIGSPSILCVIAPEKKKRKKEHAMRWKVGMKESTSSAAPKSSLNMC